MLIKPLATLAALMLATPAVGQTAPLPPAPDVAPAPAPAPDPATLAEARLVVARLMPPGFYRTVMGQAVAPITDNMTDSLKTLPLRELAEVGGLDPARAAALDQVRVDEVMAIYDPHWQERARLQLRAMVDAMGQFFTTIEPELREAMARAYASRFTLAELTDVDRFFATPSGGKFAGQMFTIASDPAMIAETRSLLPRMMQRLPDFIAAGQKATTGLPPPRRIEDLSPAERDRLAKALGVDASKLRDPPGAQ